MITEISKLTMIRVDDILGRSRKSKIVNVRHIYWLLLHQSGFTFSQIGRLNDRTEPTVFYGIKKTKERLSVGDKETTRIYEQVKHIKRL